MESLKRMFKNVRRLLQAMLLMVCLTFVLTACDDDSDSTKLDPIQAPFVVDEKFTTTVENGMTITRDESGRVTGVYTFRPAEDGIDKLMNAPTSFEDISYLFQLSEGNEVRLERTWENPAWEGLPDFPQYGEVYRQYYKGVQVAPGDSQLNYFITPQGKRMQSAYFSIIDVKDLNVKPNITEKRARQVLADYLDVERDDSWGCQLWIREYSSRKEDGKIQRDIRLTYFITGPYAPMEPDVWYCMAPRYYAEVDAHSGELIRVNM